MSSPGGTNASVPTGPDCGDTAEPPEPTSAGPGSAGFCKLDVSLRLDLDSEPSLGGWLEPKLARIADRLGVGAGTLTVATVDDGQMTRLNRQYHDTAGTTDVLTFDMRDPPGHGPLEADVVVCMDEAARQALRRGHDSRLEVLLYAVHGLLHLTGQDDRDPVAAARMHRLEDRLIAGEGLGPVYGRGAIGTQPP